jgi:NAD-dependent dihydropyrimidine dehydrogenase PreA subunit
MPAVVDPETCTGCESCVDTCPVEAISMQDDVAVVDAETCTDCESCVEVCPVEAISMQE